MQVPAAPGLSTWPSTEHSVHTHASLKVTQPGAAGQGASGGGGGEGGGGEGGGGGIEGGVSGDGIAGGRFNTTGGVGGGSRMGALKPWQ